MNLSISIVLVRYLKLISTYLDLSQLISHNSIMEIPRYDVNEEEDTNFKQLYKYMPKSNFRMLICGNLASGKTNLLYHILMKPLVYYDQIQLYGKNLEQEKYRRMIETMNGISSIRHSKLQ